MAARYESLRATALDDGAGGGLGAALLTSQGMAAWMRGWRACTPASRRSQGLSERGEPVERVEPARTAASGEVVDVLAAMALACVGG